MGVLMDRLDQSYVLISHYLLAGIFRNVSVGRIVDKTALPNWAPYALLGLGQGWLSFSQ